MSDDDDDGWLARAAAGLGIMAIGLALIPVATLATALFYRPPPPRVEMRHCVWCGRLGPRDSMRQFHAHGGRSGSRWEHRGCA